MKNAFQHISEWNGLIQTLGSLGSFIEIGTRFGGTFESLASITTGKKISIDFCDGEFGGIGAAEAARRNGRILSNYPDAYMIEGDSHSIKTVLKLNSILKGEKVDFLFIDGDHTYRGALADYMVYRQFVKDTGFIAFHDIIESEFHTKAGCFVSELWRKLLPKHVKYWVSADNSDVSEDAKGVPDHVKFGGIGLISNKYDRKVELFQPIYNQKSIDLCVNMVENYIPTLVLNLDNVYFEVAAMVKVNDTFNVSELSKVGVTSPIQHTKTGLSIDEIVMNAVNCQFFNYYNPTACDRHIWDENRVRTTLFYMAARQLDAADIVPVSLFKDEWAMLYCNYFIADTYVFARFINDWIKPTIEFFNKTCWVEWDNKKTGLLYKGKYYPMAVFVIEGLAGLFQAQASKRGLNVKQYFK